VHDQKETANTLPLQKCLLDWFLGYCVQVWSMHLKRGEMEYDGVIEGRKAEGATTLQVRKNI